MYIDVQQDLLYQAMYMYHSGTTRIGLINIKKSTLYACIASHEQASLYVTKYILYNCTKLFVILIHVHNKSNILDCVLLVFCFTYDEGTDAHVTVYYLCLIHFKIVLLFRKTTKLKVKYTCSLWGFFIFRTFSIYVSLFNTHVYRFL